MLRSSLRFAAPALAAGLVLAAGACQSPANLGSAPDREVLDVEPDPTRALDVLFVIDDSGSMADKQTELQLAAHDALFGLLDQTLGTMPDLHVAVVSTNMGAGDNNIQFCAPPGDAGHFRTGLADDCPQLDAGANFLVDVANADGTRLTDFTGDISDAFGCMASLGTQGCGLEMPLASARAALEDADGFNAGFLRPDAMLLVVFVTDEDDCSADDMRVFDPSANLGPINYRCFVHGVVCDPDTPLELGEKTGCVPREDSAYMHPVADYVAFFRSLKADPAKVMVGGIFAPREPVVVAPDPNNPQDVWVAPSCAFTSTASHYATPAVRLGAVTDAFPSRYAFSSICDLTMTEELTRVTRTTAGVMNREPCLLGPLPVTPSCHAMARAADGTTTDLPMCGDGGGDASCVRIEPDAATCGYTDTHLAARVEGIPLGAGQHLVVDCQVPTAP